MTLEEKIKELIKKYEDELARFERLLELFIEEDSGEDVSLIEMSIFKIKEFLKELDKLEVI